MRLERDASRHLAAIRAARWPPGGPDSAPTSERAYTAQSSAQPYTGGALGALEGTFYQEGYGPPLHVHTREDEVMYVIEGHVRFGVGGDEFVAGPGSWVWQPRGVPHSFKVESEHARALVIFTPAGIERMFEEGGEPAGASAEPPQQHEYDLEAAVALAKKFGFEVVGQQVGNASP